MIEVLRSIELIRKRPEMYFGGPPTPAIIFSLLVDDALAFGALHVRVDNAECWRTVSADADWLRLPEDHKVAIDRLFAGFHPSGTRVNGVRTEVFVGACAEVAYVATPNDVRVVVGAASLPESVTRVLCPPPCVRSVAFRFRDG